MEIEFSSALNALIVAGLIWQAKTTLRVAERIAVHEEKHTRHDERFNQLERRHVASRNH